MTTLEEDAVRIKGELEKLSQQLFSIDQTRQNIIEEIVKRKGMLEYINNLNGVK